MNLGIPPLHFKETVLDFAPDHAASWNQFVDIVRLCCCIALVDIVTCLALLCCVDTVSCIVLSLCPQWRPCWDAWDGKQEQGLPVQLCTLCTQSPNPVTPPCSNYRCASTS
jgi:hypothetical protein